MEPYLIDDSALEVEIPYAEAPDLIASLLSFEASELGGEHPEDLLLEKACDIKGWQLEGSHPRFLVEQWLEVFVTGHQQGHCRILNARAHTALQPFTLDTVIQEFSRQIHWLRNHQIPEDFSAWLLAAYDELDEAQTRDIALHEVYRLINARQPSYRREAFGFDLACTLAGSPLLDGRRVRLGFSNGPRHQRFALCLGEGKSAQLADRIRIDAPLQSLDI